MSERIVICEKCSGIINSRDELVTAVLLYAVIPYHERCYARDLKGAKTFFLDNQPLNGFSGNFIFIVSVIIALFWLIFADSKWYSIVAMIPIAYRLYSYFVYEVYTKKEQ